MFIPVDCEWDEFGDWNPCNVTCGGGTEFRGRTIRTQAQYGGQECLGKAIEKKQCNVHGCPGTEYLIYITNYLYNIIIYLVVLF